MPWSVPGFARLVALGYVGDEVAVNALVERIDHVVAVLFKLAQRGR